MHFTHLLAMCATVGINIMPAAAQYGQYSVHDATHSYMHTGSHHNPSPNNFQPNINTNHPDHADPNEMDPDRMGSNPYRNPNHEHFPVDVKATITAIYPEPSEIVGIHPHFAKDTKYLRARGDNTAPGVYVCNGPGWSHNCHWTKNVAHACYNVPISDTLALGPDPGIQCMVWDENNCSGQGSAGNLVTPGLTQWVGYQGLTKAPRSYMCQPCNKAAPNCGTPGALVMPWITSPCLACHW